LGLIDCDEKNNADFGSTIYRIDQNISMGYFTMAGTQMQVHSQLFSLCGRGIKKTWLTQRLLARHKENIEMSSMGRPWV
jgi:hypothetical protein